MIVSGSCLLIALRAAVLAPAQPDPRDHEADEPADEDEDRVAERRDEDRQDEHEDRHPDGDACPDREVLADLEAEVRPGELARQVRAEVALLDDLVEIRQRGALGDEIREPALPGAGLGTFLPARRVALQAGADARPAAGGGDAEGDEDDCAGRRCGDDDRQAEHRNDLLRLRS